MPFLMAIFGNEQCLNENAKEVIFFKFFSLTRGVVLLLIAKIFSHFPTGNYLK